MTEAPPLSPCHFFQLQSHNVWERIAFARQMNLRISETTVTEQLLFHFYQYFEAFRLPMRLFESIEEHRNGSDLEVLIKTDRGYLLLACQAKITYKTGNYRAFHHRVGGARQIDLLLDYAERHGGIAQYLFYNFAPDWMLEPGMAQREDLDNLGITFLEATEIIDWMASYEAAGRKVPTPHFNTFHPMAAQPFHELICRLLQYEQAHLQLFPNTQLATVRYYQEKEISDADSWRRVTTLGRIGFVEQSVVSNPETDESFISINPGNNSHHRYLNPNSAW